MYGRNIVVKASQLQSAGEDDEIRRDTDGINIEDDSMAEILHLVGSEHSRSYRPDTLR